MIKLHFRTGDVLTVPYDFIVHSVNMQGVMGSGIARAIKERWPSVFRHYRMAYESGILQLGTIHLSGIEDGRYVVNLVGQNHYGVDRKHADFAAIKRGLVAVGFLANKRGNSTTVAMPLMGAGLGGGTKEEFLRVINEIVEENPTWEFEMYIHEL